MGGFGSFAARVRHAIDKRTISTGMLTAATTAVVVMAVTATGIPLHHVSAHDGGVWLTNDQPGQDFRGVFGEFNVPVKQIGYTFGAPGKTLQTSYRLDVLQQGPSVLAIDEGQGSVYPVDSETGTPDTSAGITVPSGGVVAFGGGNAAILQPATSTQPARLWAAPVGRGAKPSIDGMNPSKVKPILKIPGGTALAVDERGDVFVASRTKLVTLPAVAGGFGPTRTTTFRQALSSVSVTAVGTTPVVLDSAEKVVRFPASGRTTTLPASAISAKTVLLQQSGPGDPAVLVATDSALYSVPLDATPPSTLATVGVAATPAAPVRLDGCAYSAWSGTPGRAAQACENGVTVSGELPGSPVGGVALPVFRVNHDEIILNDSSDGAAWTVVGKAAQALTTEDWLRVLVGTNARQSDSPDSSTALTASQQKQRPKLDNPPLRARAGRDSVLHILDYDSDPGGSILSITGVSPANGPGFHLKVTPDTQSVVLSLQPDVTSPISFSYQVVDGAGLVSSGPVTVTPTTDETPPVAVAGPPPPRPVVSGGTVTMQVLGNWRDPENDPITLADVSITSGTGQVSWSSDGLVTFKAATVVADTPTVLDYHITDGTKVSAGQVPLRILGSGDVTAYPPTGLPDAEQILVGRPTVISPLANDLFGADPNKRGAQLALAGPVGSPAGMTVTTNTDAGQLIITASRPGVYSLSYQASYGAGLSERTQILVQAAEPVGTNLPPVTIPQAVLLHGQYPATIDVLAQDYDPAGGLLTVVGVTNPAGIQATVVDGEYLRIASTSSAPGASHVLTYQVTNGRSDPVAGQVTVLWQPASPPQPPVVPDSFATVRAGDEIDIPVLRSATDPDGEAVHLVDGGTPNSTQVLPAADGSASVSGGYLRYSAPAPKGIASPQTVTVSYEAENQSGLRTTGFAYITVVPDDPTSTTPPAPSEVDARVTSGGTVTIPIPTSGVAADGDSVTLTGVTTPPQLGRIMSFNANSITYQAFPTVPGTGAFAGGTDSFTYEVEGPTGLTGTAQVRVGISPPGQPQPPVAVDHFVTATPGQQVDVDLIAGDFVPASRSVSVVPLSSTNSSVPAGVILAGASHSVLRATAPLDAAPLSVAYGITNGTGPPSVAHVVVRAQSQYVSPPTVIDQYPMPPPLSTKTLTVDVLAGASDPGHSAADLTLLESPTPGALVTGRSLVVPVGPAPRNVSFVVKSIATGATTVGVVHVPGAGAGPQLKPGSLIRVPAGGSTTVDIGNYVTEPGHQIRLTTNQGVVAVPAGGLSERVDSNTTVTLTGGVGYAGPGALTIQVIDSSTLSAAGARTATLSIPVEVGHPTALVRCPTAPLGVVPGGPAVDVDVAAVCQVWAPDGTNPSTVAFTASWAAAAPGVDLGWAGGRSGHVIAITAGASAKGGDTGSITVGVSGAPASAGSTISVQVVGALPPTATPADPPPVHSGQTATVDMAQYVTSPLSRPQIYVVSVQQTTGPPARASTDRSTVSISPPVGTHGTLTYAVVVSDAGPGRPDRYVDDTITVQILDVPGAPSDVQGTPGNKLVTLTWTAAADNGSPVQSYVVSMGGTSRATSGTSDTWTGLTNGQPYAFTVTAVNAVGRGLPSAPITVSPRAAPDAPGSVTATTANLGPNTASVSWAPANDEGEPITGYTVYVSPSSGGATSMTAGAGQTSLTWTGLSDSQGPYSFTVVAHNGVGSSSSSPPSNQVYAHGIPPSPAPPSASGSVSTDQTSTTITVSWPAITDCNDAQACAQYLVTEIRDGNVVTTDTVSGCAGGAAGGCAVFGPIPNDGSSYTYTVAAVNRENQTSPASGQSSPPVKAVGVPGAVTDLSATAHDTSMSVSFTLPASHGASISEVRYAVTGGSPPISGAWPSPGAPGQSVQEQINSLVNGTSYTVTVSACNEAGECGANSNAASADPYGVPNGPSVSASSGQKTSITFTWTGGGNNGRPVASYTLCVDGSCSNVGSAPSSRTMSFACSTSHTAYGFVVDTMGQRSPNSSTVSGSTATCDPPGAPAVATSASGNIITYSWSGGGGSGLPISYYELCIDGNCSNVGASPGSQAHTYSCGETHSAYAYVVDSAGQRSTNSATASATTAACTPPQVSISWGGKAPASGCGGDTSCTYLEISWSNFSSGSHTITPHFDGGGWGYPSQVRSGTTGNLNNFYFAGYCGSSHSVDVDVDGVMSNTINTTQHSC